MANLELFRRVADMCADADLLLLIEPHPDTLSMENRWCIDLIDGLDRENAGIVYDCCHYGVGQPDSYVQAIGQLGRRIRHIHFSDGDASDLCSPPSARRGNSRLAGGSAVASRRSAFVGTLTNDLFNYPLLEDGAMRNAPKIRAVEDELGISR